MCVDQQKPQIYIVKLASVSSLCHPIYIFNIIRALGNVSIRCIPPQALSDKQINVGLFYFKFLDMTEANLGI